MTEGFPQRLARRDQKACINEREVEFLSVPPVNPHCSQYGKA